jgi:hypothetical protein
LADNGETWASGKTFFIPDSIYGFRRTFTKVYSNGVDKIHFVLKDGHPHYEKDNDIYYMNY